MAGVTGICDARFTALRDLLQYKIDADEELGASLVVNIDGENVVDIWGGYADAAKTKPWEENTITNVWSTSKTVVSLAALLLIDRGLLNPFEKVSKYWAEFGVNGKENIEVRHLLSHSSGVSGWDEPITIEEICNVEKATARLVTQAPWWTPGTASGYHSLTMGHLIGALILRITGKTIAQVIADELTIPLAADFQFGVAETDRHRLADIIPPPTAPAASHTANINMTSVFAKTLLNPIMHASIANQAVWQDAIIPAANGSSNARGIARLLSFISCNGTVRGVKLLTPSTIDLIFTEQTRGPDLVLGAATRFGVGYGLSGVSAEGVGEWVPEGRVCFWCGWGGSMAVMDVGRGVTVAYVMNKMGSPGLGDGLAREYIGAVYRALGANVAENV